MIDICIYDMDKTVTRRATYAAFLAHMALATAPWRIALLPLVGMVMLAYVLGMLGRRRVKELNQALMMGYRVRRETIAEAVEHFADSVVARNIKPGARAQIDKDKASGAVLVMASASYRLYVAPIAHRLGFDHVIATDHMGQDADWLRARIAGENCYDAAKLRMIEAWLVAQGWARKDCRICAYSDHVTDAPMLGWADEGVAVNPHRPLRSLAAVKGWKIVDWA